LHQISKIGKRSFNMIYAKCGPWRKVNL